MHRSPLFSVAQPHSIHPGACPHLKMIMMIKNVMKIMAIMTRMTIIIIMMLVPVLLFKSQPCSNTPLHTITCWPLFLKLHLTYLHIFSIPPDPFQELNMFQHSPPHQSLVGPLPCRAMMTHQCHRVDQALNKIMMIILHFRILKSENLSPFSSLSESELELELDRDREPDFDLKPN